jgi:hypothetical protein
MVFVRRKYYPFCSIFYQLYSYTALKYMAFDKITKLSFAKMESPGCSSPRVSVRLVYSSE